jgi:hypothetical protein
MSNGGKVVLLTLARHLHIPLGHVFRLDSGIFLEKNVRFVTYQFRLLVRLRLIPCAGSLTTTKCIALPSPRVSSQEKVSVVS